MIYEKEDYQTITYNAIKCKHCNTIIESTHTHDFKWCTCTRVAVDGGKQYLRRVGHPDDMIDLSS